MTTLTKAAVLKDVTSEGEVEAVVATLHVVDKDGDYTLPGFFGTQPTKLVSGHDWSQIMLGKGTVTDGDGQQAVFHGKLNLDDPAAAALHAKLRFDMAHPPPLIEWSYGFRILPGGSRPAGEQDPDGARQILQPRPDGTPGAKVWEVSPVLVGAGEGTRTVDVKTAVRSHSTDISDGPWSARQAVAQADTAEELRYVHAWYDPDGDPTSPTTYKLPHHEGPGGPANVRACIAGIAALNGARGGVDIPAQERPAVWRHLARHLADAGRDAPELRNSPQPATLKFSDQLAVLVVDIAEVVDRAEAILDLRAEKGRGLGEGARVEAAAAAAELDRLRTVLDRIAAAHQSVDVVREWLHTQRTLTRLAPLVGAERTR